MTNDLFGPAIDELQKSETYYWGPVSFQHYLRRNKLPPKNTAQYISIDSLEKLPPSLRENDIMVFRLGTSKSKDVKGTQFALVKSNLSDFFIFQPEDSRATTYLPKVGIRDLFAYQVLPVFTESSLLNLALASGLISDALGLDDRPILNPATGQSTFTFKLKLHSSIEKVFIHHKGQVEIDTLFLGRKSGKDYIYIIEAKSGYQNCIL